MRFIRWVWNPKSKFSFADDVQRQAEKNQSDQQKAGALAYLLIRFLLFAQGLLKGDVRREGRVIAGAKKQHVRLVTHRARWTKKLSSAKWVKRMAAVRAHEAAETEIGHIVVWIIYAGLLGLKIMMIILEPPFMYTTMRGAQDVPESVGLWSGDPRVVLAAASGILMAVALLLLTFASARGIALTLFYAAPEPPGDEAPEYPAWTRSLLLLPRGHRATLTGISLAFLAGVTVLLHTFAVSRVEGVAFNGAASASNTALIVLITALPWLVVGLGVIHEHPVLHHTSQVQRWAFGFSWKEFKSVRWEVWTMNRYRRSRRLAQRGALRLADAADRIGLRADAEVTQAAITLGTDAPAIGAYTGRDKGLDTIDGKAAIAFSDSNLPLFHELTEVIKQAKALPDVGEIPELFDTWEQLREPKKAAAPSDHALTGTPDSSSISPNRDSDVVDLREPQPTDLTTEEGKN